MMTVPKQEQIHRAIELLKISIKNLIDNDSDIFNTDEIMPENISEDAKVLARQLHEVTINHRFAHYLETNMPGTGMTGYNVDIEYNRFYNNPKLVQTTEGLIEARPDIIIHSRRNKEISPQHYLIVEAKKGKFINTDVAKVNGFMTDDNYNYLFGVLISYCQDPDNVTAWLHYFDGTRILHELMLVKK
ncbi:hypothetical protein Q4E93_09945 [Flavitalea sp. BT771]|uniref:hypothetical protein n=1 Tax=Flavitalea sp. BT771 TaxID=3063329 RepID=UPI0026E14208|nr:hypothetical protein [Flavitalea sp. BT771]MDO6430909.1 hypothetical protein [Flavitalea sp. BT771]MDV6218951.1 hypothetical protein [Flavitalea sp. BT771]